MPSQSALNVDAVVQGVVIAITIIGLAVVYFDRLSTISSNLDRIADSMEEIDDTNFGRIADSIDQIDQKVTSVDLKDMERATNKMRFYIESQQGGPQHNPDNSVRYDLPELRNALTISFVEQVRVNDWPEIPESELPVPGSRIQFEFDREIDSRRLVDDMIDDEELLQKEIEVLGFGSSCQPRSPYELVFTVAEDDFDKIADWIPVILDWIESNQVSAHQQRDQFDRAVEERLFNDSD